MTRKQNSKSSDRPSSSPRTIARIAEAKLRNAARPERPALEYKLEGATTFTLTSRRMSPLGRARRAQSVEQLQAHGALATKLLRTFTSQTEALAKIKRGGEQTVRVEHVHVYQGGQAIVGAVSNRKGEGGGDDEKGNQAYGTQVQRAITAAPGPALLGSNQIRDALPETRGDSQEAVPSPWRGGK